VSPQAGEGAPPLALRVALADEAVAEVVQPFDSAATAEIVEAFLIARAQAPGRAEITLSGESTDGGTWT
jgi:hypothetical protein